MQQQPRRFMSPRWFPVLVVSASIAGALRAQETTEAEPAAREPQAASPVSLRGPEDAGRFTLYRNEEPIITSEFTWSAEGAYQGHSTLSMGGQTIEFSVKIEPDEEGHWKRIE